MTDKLKSDDYWEWRASIEELEKYRLKAENAYLKYVAAEAFAKAANLEAKLLKVAMDTERKESDFVAKEYTKFCDDLEKRVGFKVRNRVIDPKTFEVKDVEGQ